MSRRFWPRGGYDGLEANTLQVLAALKLKPGLTATELVDVLALRQGTVSTALARLHELGHVRTDADAADGRRRPRHLTADGEAVLRRLVADVLID